MRVLNDNINVEDEEDEIINQEVQDKEPIVTRSGRRVKKLAYLEHDVLSAMSYSDDVPQNYSEIESRRDRMDWRKAIKRRAMQQYLGNNRIT
jgi:hypothetical protein